MKKVRAKGVCADENCGPRPREFYSRGRGPKKAVYLLGYFTEITLLLRAIIFM